MVNIVAKKRKMKKKLHFNSNTIHGGQEPKKNNTITNIYNSKFSFIKKYMIY